MTADFKQGASLLGGVLASGCVNPTYACAFTGSPTGGTFTVSITTGIGGVSNTQSTGAITYSASLTAASIQATVQALPGMSSVMVTGPNGGPFTFTIPNSLGVSTVSISAQALTGGSTPSAAITSNGVSTLLYAVPVASAVKVATFYVSAAAGQAGYLSISVIPNGGAQDGTHVAVPGYPLVAYDFLSQEDVLSVVKGAMWDAGTQLYLYCPAAVTYGLTGAVSS